MIPPSRLPPSWAMQSPSATIGELEVKNCGYESGKLSFRQSSMPPRGIKAAEDAADAERYDFSVGHGRRAEPGPGKLSAGAVRGFSFIGFLPGFVAGGRVETTQGFPCLLEARACVKLSTDSTSVATPSPTVTCHFLVSSLGQAAGTLKPVTLASRFGPHRSGQSCADAGCPGARRAAVEAAPELFDCDALDHVTSPCRLTARFPSCGFSWGYWLAFEYSG